MNLCLEEAAAVTIEMWGLIDRQPTWVAFKFGEEMVVQIGKKKWDWKYEDEFLFPAHQDLSLWSYKSA